MIIKCTHCETNFRIDEHEVGEYGRMVCCSVCGYEWLYIADNNTIPLKESYQSLVIKKYHNSKIKKFWTFIYTFIFLLIFLFFCYIEREFIVEQHPFFTTIYSLFD